MGKNIVKAPSPASLMRAGGARAVIDLGRYEALEAVARTAKAALAAAESKAKSDFAFVKHQAPEMNDLSNAIDALEKTK